MNRKTLWSIARIVLAVVLLAAVFFFFITLRDFVLLKDGTKVYGTLIGDWAGPTVTEVTILPRSAWEKMPMPDITLDAAGRLVIPVGDIAQDKRGALSIERGLFSILKGMQPAGLIIGFIIMGLVPVVAAWRWQMLLHAHEIRIGYWHSMELTLIGLFFNNFMPGLTGGDVVKAYYAAKLTHEKKTHAVVTVFLDRVIGIVALALIAGIAIVGGFYFGAIGGRRYTKAAWFTAVFIAVCAAATFGFYSVRLRRAAGRAVRALPGYAPLRNTTLAARTVGLFRRADESLMLYKRKKSVLVWTTLISFIAHSSAIMSIYFFGRALGIVHLNPIHYFIIVPVCFIVSSVPITPAGWGVGEGVFKYFFGAVAVAGTVAVTMSVIYRIIQALWTIPGGFFLMFQRDRKPIEEVEREMSEDIEQDDAVH